MNRAKRIGLNSLLAAALIVVVSGCGSSNDSGNTSNAGANNAPAADNGAGNSAAANTPAATDNPYKDHLDISFPGGASASASEQHDELVQKIEEDFNVTLKPVDIGWDNYKEKNQVWSAAGQLPDIITNSIVNDNPATYNQWVSKDSFMRFPKI